MFALIRVCTEQLNFQSTAPSLPLNHQPLDYYQSISYQSFSEDRSIVDDSHSLLLPGLRILRYVYYTLKPALNYCIPVYWLKKQQQNISG